MRKLKYLSPTGIKKFYDDRTNWYLQYMAEKRPPREPQTKPMSIGSAFDAFVKNYLVKSLTGTCTPEFEIDTIFEAQVEPHNRDWARLHGYWVFKCYKESGALARLMTELELADSTPKFELTVEARVAHKSCVAGVPLLGKPDVFFHVDGVPVIVDWKVNGYCGKSKTSPRKGYIHYIDGWKDGQHSRNHLQPHRDAMVVMKDGLLLNMAVTLDEVNVDWAHQLAIYSWVLGEAVGAPITVGIDQICGQEAPLNIASSTDVINRVGFAQHRCKIDEKWQEWWFNQIAGCWQIIQSGHIFSNLPRAESDVRCKQLDGVYKAFEVKDDKDKWYNEMMGR